MPTQGLQEIKPSDLEKLADDLRNRAAMFSKLARQMQSSGVKKIDVMGSIGARDGFKKVVMFYNKCATELDG